MKHRRRPLAPGCRNAAALVLSLAALLAPRAGRAEAPKAPAAPPPPAKVATLKTTALAGSVSLIEGVDGFAGGNVAVSAGPDGVFLVDDELPPYSSRLLAALAALSPRPPRLVFNTHWHHDHAGGNEALAGAGALVVAHDRARRRMSVEQVIEGMAGKPGRNFPALPAAALPVVTFAEELTFHLNGDEIHVFHLPRAHTDGDAAVHFRQANVIHMGDAYLAGAYPLIDLHSGGTIDGFIAGATRVIALCDDATRSSPATARCPTGSSSPPGATCWSPCATGWPGWPPAARAWPR